MLQTETTFLEIVFKYKLAVIPIRSVVGGKCTCKNTKCRSPGKHPIFSQSWKMIASDDENKINGWIKKYKNLNFAIATGRLCELTGKYLVVVDIDKDNHELVPLLPKTVSYKTGGGGYHFWYWSKKPIKNSVSLLAKQVDIRGSNGYVIVPPSTHVSGNKYELLPNSIVSITDLPDNIATLLSAKRNKKEVEPLVKKIKLSTSDGKDILWGILSIQEIRELLAKKVKIPCGMRNVTIFRLLASDRAKGAATKEDVSFRAKEYANSCELPETLSEEELGKTVDSIMKYPCYNSSHDKINHLYVKWIEKNGSQIDENLEKKLDEIDNQFFSQLKPSKNGISLELIKLARESFFKSKNIQF
jgi:hypothetical protein